MVRAVSPLLAGVDRRGYRGHVAKRGLFRSFSWYDDSMTQLVGLVLDACCHFVWVLVLSQVVICDVTSLNAAAAVTGIGGGVPSISLAGSGERVPRSVCVGHSKQVRRLRGCLCGATGKPANGTGSVRVVG